MNIDSISVEKLLEGGAHFGHQVRRGNPKMDRYRHDTKKGVFVFDLFKTREEIATALDVMAKAASEKKLILILGSKKQIKENVKEVAQAAGIPYVNERWLGGTFSNFKQIRASVDRLQDMKKKMAAGEFDDRTKKERLDIGRDIEKMERKFGGLVTMDRNPDLMVIIDTQRERSAVKEANEAGIEVIGIVDSNGNPDLVDYPIPMNDDAPEGVTYVLELMAAALATVVKPVEKKAKAKKASKKVSTALTTEEVE